jgi:regulatory protein
MAFKAKTVKPPLDRAGLLEYAVRSLSSKMKSVHDLRQKMKDRAEPGEAGQEAMDAVIAKLKGIAQELTNSTLKTAYEDVDEVALAKEYVERKRMKKPEGDKEIARAMRRLMAAGFSTKTIWKVLRSWGAEVEEVDVEESE